MAERTTKVTITGQASGYIEALRQAGQATHKWADDSSAKLAAQKEAMNNLGRTATAMGGAILAVYAAALKRGVEYNTLQQSSRAALTSMLGSLEAANAQMDALDEWAMTSPFAKDTFIKAQQQMLAFGIEAKKVVPYLDAIQNAVAAAGGSNNELLGITSIMAKIQSSAKITGQDLMQFGNYGIDAATLIGSQMGKTGRQIRDEITAGTIGAEEALDALAAGMSQRFDGAAAGVKNTMVGAMDRIKGAWRDLSSELAEPFVSKEGGGWLVDRANDLADFLRWIQSLPEPLKVTIALAGAGAGAIALFGGAALLAVPKIAEYRKAMEVMNLAGGKLDKTLNFLGRSIRGLFVAGAILGGLKMLGDGIQSIIDSSGGLVSTQQQLENFLTTSQTADELLSKISESRRGMTDETYSAIEGVDRLSNSLRVLRENQDTRGWEFWADVFAFVGVNNFKGANTYANALYESLEALGGEMAKMFSSGQIGNAQVWFKTFKEEGKLTNDEILQMINLSPELKDSLTEIATQMGLTADDTVLLDIALGNGIFAFKETKIATTEVRQSLAEMSGSAIAAADQVKGLKDAIDGFASVTLSARDAERAFQESVDAAAESLKENGNSLDISTEKGRRNEAALDALARATLRSTAALSQTGATQEEIAEKMAEGRSELIKLLGQFGITGEAAQEYADNLGLIPKNIYTAVQLTGADEFLYKSELIKKALNDIPQSVGVMVGTGAGQREAFAGGGTVKGTGGPKADSVLIRASVDEEIIQNPWAGYYRPILKEINQGTYKPNVTVKNVLPDNIFDGMSITGTMEITGDGLVRIIDGRLQKQNHAAFVGGMR